MDVELARRVQRQAIEAADDRQPLHLRDSPDRRLRTGLTRRFLQIHTPGGDPALHPSLDEDLEKKALSTGLDGHTVAFLDDEARGGRGDGFEEVGQLAGVRVGMDEGEHLVFIASRGHLFQACDKGLDGIRLPRRLSRSSGNDQQQNDRGEKPWKHGSVA